MINVLRNIGLREGLDIPSPPGLLFSSTTSFLLPWHFVHVQAPLAHIASRVKQKNLPLPRESSAPMMPPITVMYPIA